MENNIELIKIIKEDNNRKKFFLKKISENLKRYSLEADDNEIESLFDEALENYNEKDTKVTLLFYLIGYIRKKLEQKNINKEKFELFSWQEINIINQYLEFDKGKCLSLEEIKRNNNSINVNKVIKKLKKLILEDPSKIEKIFPNVQEKLKKRNLYEHKNIPKVISQDDLELLGLFTGQINDICLDIEELAATKNLYPSIIKTKLIDIYYLLKDNNNLNKVLTQYPDILDMLIIRGTTLGITLPENILEFQIIKDAEFLKQIYGKNNEGNFSNLFSTTTKINNTYKILRKKITRIEQQIATNNTYKQQIISYYPTYFEDKFEYFKTKDTPSKKEKTTPPKKEKATSSKKENTTSPKKTTKRKYHYNRKRKTTKNNYDEYLEFIKVLLEKDKENFYLSLNAIAKLKNKNVNSIFFKRKIIFECFLNDSKFREYIQNNIPELYKELEFLINLEDDNFFINTILEKDENLNLCSIEETAEKIHIRPLILKLRKIKIINKAQQDENYRQKLLENNANFAEELLKLDSIKYTDKKRNSKNFEYYYNILQILTKKSNKKFSPLNNIAILLDIDINELVNILNKIYMELDNNSIFRDFINKKDPEVLTLALSRKKMFYDITPNEKVIIDEIFSNKTRVMENNKIIAKNLKLNTEYFSHLKTSIAFKLIHNNQIADTYKAEITTAHIQNNYTSLTSINMSNEQLNQIKENVKNLDIPNYYNKDIQNSLNKILNNLNRSVYRDYVKLCNYEQKIILALRLGFVNKTIYSTSDVAKLCNVSTQYVDLLVNECIKLCKNNFNTFKNKVKINKK